MSYITLTELKEYLGIPVEQSEDDNLLLNCAARAQALVESQTGRKFEAATETRYFTQKEIDGQILWLYSDDLQTVTELKNGDGTVIAATDYVLEPLNSSPKFAVRLKSGLSWEFTDDDSLVSITGTWGFKSTVPEDIKQATLRTATWLYRQKDTTADSDRPLMTNDGVTIMPSALPNDVRQILAPYVRRI